MTQSNTAMTSLRIPSAIFLLVVTCEGFLLDSFKTNRTVVQILDVGNGAQWGSWAEPEFCPQGAYATGFNIKLEPNQRNGDNTTLNGIQLICEDGNQHKYNVTSAVGPWGNWLDELYCDMDQYLTAFQLRVEKPLGIFGDDTAVDYIKFLCKPFYGGAPRDLFDQSNDLGFGTWGDFSTTCPDKSAICGLNTKVELPQNIAGLNTDDTALNDVLFYCCTD